MMNETEFSCECDSLEHFTHWRKSSKNVIYRCFSHCDSHSRYRILLNLLYRLLCLPCCNVLYPKGGANLLASGEVEMSSFYRAYFRLLYFSSCVAEVQLLQKNSRGFLHGILKWVLPCAQKKINKSLGKIVKSLETESFKPLESSKNHALLIVYSALTDDLGVLLKKCSSVNPQLWCLYLGCWAKLEMLYLNLRGLKRFEGQKMLLVQHKKHRNLWPEIASQILARTKAEPQFLFWVSRLRQLQQIACILAVAIAGMYPTLYGARDLEDRGYPQALDMSSDTMKLLSVVLQYYIDRQSQNVELIQETKADLCLLDQLWNPLRQDISGELLGLLSEFFECQAAEKVLPAQIHFLQKLIDVVCLEKDAPGKPKE